MTLEEFENHADSKIELLRKEMVTFFNNSTVKIDRRTIKDDESIKFILYANINLPDKFKQINVDLNISPKNPDHVYYRARYFKFNELNPLFELINEQQIRSFE